MIFSQKESILDFDKASPSAIGSSQPPSVTPASSPAGRQYFKCELYVRFLQTLTGFGWALDQ